MSEHRNELWEQGAPSDRFKRLEETIFFGNGKPGLCTRMETVENNVASIREREERRARKQDRIEVAVWAGVFLMILNLIVSHLK